MQCEVASTKCGVVRKNKENASQWMDDYFRNMRIGSSIAWNIIASHPLYIFASFSFIDDGGSGWCWRESHVLLPHLRSKQCVRKRKIHGELAITTTTIRIYDNDDDNSRLSTAIRRRASAGQLNCCHSFLCRCVQYGFIAYTPQRDRRAMAYAKIRKERKKNIKQQIHSHTTMSLALRMK